MSEERPAPVADTGTDIGAEGLTLEPGQVPNAPEPTSRIDSRGRDLLRDVLESSGLVSFLAIVVSLAVGAILIVLTNTTVQTDAGYFFARPSDTIVAAGNAIGGAYAALFSGGVVDFSAVGFWAGIQPLLTSLGFATPLIAAGLGIAIGFRAGLFNIGGQGQILAGGAVAGWIGFALQLPPGIHLIVAVLGGLLGGAAFSAIAGVLKAETGAHEVIVTIMLNYVAYYGIDQLLHTPLLEKPGSNDPQSPGEHATAIFPSFFGSNVNLGFLFAIAATVGAWWLLNRSSLGFRFRAVGENPAAARTAGISVRSITIIAMVVSGLLVGLAGAYQVLGQTTTGFSNDFDAGIGFNAITVALLGRSRPWGVFWAGILFGVFQAGGYTLQASQGVDVDLVGVLQSVIVLFIAAPPLIRAIFRLPAPGSKSRRPA